MQFLLHKEGRVCRKHPIGFRQLRKKTWRGNHREGKIILKGGFGGCPGGSPARQLRGSWQSGRDGRGWTGMDRDGRRWTGMDRDGPGARGEGAGRRVPERRVPPRSTTAERIRREEKFQKINIDPVSCFKWNFRESRALPEEIKNSPIPSESRLDLS